VPDVRSGVSHLVERSRCGAVSRHAPASHEQGYGHTADDADRPVNFEQSADDAAALLQSPCRSGRYSWIRQWWHDRLPGGDPASAHGSQTRDSFRLLKSRRGLACVLEWVCSCTASGAPMPPLRVPPIARHKAVMPDAADRMPAIAACAIRALSFRTSSTQPRGKTQLRFSATRPPPTRWTWKPSASRSGRSFPAPDFYHGTLAFLRESPNP